MNSYATKPISLSCGKLLAFLPSRLCCLMKVAMYLSKYVMLLTLSIRNSLVPNSNIITKFPFQNYELMSVFMLYRITEVPIEVEVSALG